MLTKVFSITVTNCVVCQIDSPDPASYLPSLIIFKAYLNWLQGRAELWQIKMHVDRPVITRTQTHAHGGADSVVAQGSESSYPAGWLSLMTSPVRALGAC